MTVRTCSHSRYGVFGDFYLVTFVLQTFLKRTAHTARRVYNKNISHKTVKLGNKMFWNIGFPENRTTFAQKLKK